MGGTMKQSLYYLSGFNNYYNRQVKLPKSQRIDEYNDYIVISTLATNFNPNDNVDAEMVVNYPSDVDDTIELDYLLVSEDNINVNSRWFVVDRKRNLAGQWKVSLRRDLIADHFDEVINSPVFIEKAVPKTIDNKLIFNSENMSYNQIKKNEIQLKDESGMGWLVGYVSPKDFGSITISLPESGANYPSPAIDYDTLMSYSYRGGIYSETGTNSLQYTGVMAAGVPATSYGKEAIVTVSLWDDGRTTAVGTEYNNEQYRSDILWHYQKGQLTNVANNIGALVRTNREAFTAGLYNLLQQNVSKVRVGRDTLNTLANMNGITFSDGQRLFTVTVGNRNTVDYRWGIDNPLTSSSGSAYTVAKSILDQSGAAEYNSYTPKPAGTGIWAMAQYEEISVSVTTASLPATTVTVTNAAKILKDQPYRMFAIPVGNKQTCFAGSTSTFRPNADLGKLLASKLATQLGGTDVSFIYDLQYLPYCPVRGALQDYTRVTIYGTEGTDYNLLKDSQGNILQYILWADESSFSFNINFLIQVPNTPIDFKVANETKFVRITSPNYNGSYEFKPTMNYGVTGFEVNCTYKPFQPYIFVAPLYNSNGLYGGDFNDQRGLVCSGDFSVTLLNDSWIDYQIQNKSYSDAFNRQVQNMATNYALNREQQRIAGILNTVSSGIGGATSGAMLGGMIGGPVGAGIGVAGGLLAGIGGAAASAWGLKQDLKFSDALHSEALQNTRDLFTYQLQNIQALPYTLGKVSAFSINNKIFPFLEYYQATEEEEEALRLKLKYSGFSIMSIGTMSDYIQSTGGGEPIYMQVQLIRYPSDGNMDYHEATELASELHKGVYI